MGKRSEATFERAKEVIPDGPNSPIRSFSAVGGTPLFIEQGLGSRIFDIDNIQYIDCIGSWGPLILGHAHRYVVEAIRKAATRGSSFGTPSIAEVELTEMISEAMPSLERIRLVDSGSEATVSALRLARAATGRKKVLKFDGAYHGDVDGLLVKPGLGNQNTGIPDVAGVPKEFTNLTVSVPYNDLDAVRAAFEKWKDKFAAIIVEPVAAHMGCVPPAEGFLAGLRQICDSSGALLIFDEAITGFRVAWGGAQSLFGVTPDITTLGSAIGGGLPLGAFGASTKLMGQLATAGPGGHAGTMTGNPISIAAGKSTLSVLKNNSVYREIDERGGDFVKGVMKAGQTHGVPVTINRVGSMWSMFFTDEPVFDLPSARKSNLDRFVRFFHLMLAEGVCLPPSQFESAFFSSAHAGKDLNQIVERMDRSLKKIAWEFER